MMHVSYVKVRVTEIDIMSIIHDYVNIEGLTIEEVNIVDGLITVKGSYKKLATIPFLATLGVGSVKEDEIRIKIFKITGAKIRISLKLVHLILSKTLKSIEDIGISIEDGHIVVNFIKVQKIIPMITFKPQSVNVKTGYIEAEMDTVEINQKKETTTIDKIKEEKQEMLLKNRIIAEDIYTKIRATVAKMFQKNIKVCYLI